MNINNTLTYPTITEPAMPYDRVLCVVNCSCCNEKPQIECIYISGIKHYIICCNNCENKYINDVGKWFITFPWIEQKDAVDEWSKACNCKNGINQLKLF